MAIMRELKHKFGRVKLITGAVQDEVTSAIINSVVEVQKEHSSAEALKVAQLFNKAISLYDEGVPLATALLAISELSKEKKNAAKIFGFTAISVASILPYLLVNQKIFEEFVDDLREDADKEMSRNRQSKVTRLKPRKKS
jgi:hypothetical protein